MGGILKRISLERKKLRKEKVYKLLSKGFSIKEVGKRMNISDSCVYKIKDGIR